MNLKQLWERRVPQITGAYLVSGWGIIQFVTFLEERYRLSPHLVELVALSLLFLIPTVALLAWCHGRPGKDRWTKTQLVAVPANLVFAGVVLFLLFQSKDLGAVTTTVEVADENGNVSTRVIPKNEHRRHITVFFFETIGDEPEAEWLGAALTSLVTTDLYQDAFFEIRQPFSFLPRIRSDLQEGRMIFSQAKNRDIAESQHTDTFLTGTIAKEGEDFVVSTELHETRGGILSERTFRSPDLFKLVDDLTRTLRTDIDIPDWHMEQNPDLPVTDIYTGSLPALRAQTLALLEITVRNDYRAAKPLLEEAVAADPDFAITHFLLYATHTTLQDSQAAEASIKRTLATLYRVPERNQYAIKSSYYLNVSREPDKALAVLDMWSQLYPDDVDARTQKAFLHTIRNEKALAIAEYAKVLEIDSQSHRVLRTMASLSADLGDYEKAEEYASRYVELYPKEVRAYGELAEILESTGSFDRALEMLDKAILLQTGEAGQPQAIQARILWKQGEFDRAENTLTAALGATSAPEIKAVLLDRLFDLHRIQGRNQEAIDDFEAMHVEIAKFNNPMNASMARLGNIHVYAAAGRAEEGLAKVDAIAKGLVEPVTRMPSLGYARVHLAAGNYDEVSDHLDIADSFISEFKVEILRPAVLLDRAKLAVGQQDYTKALGYLKEARAGDGTINELDALEGRCLRETGKAKESKRVLEAALNNNPADPPINLQMALTMENLGKRGDAVEFLETALKGWERADADFSPKAEAERLRAEWTATS